MSKKSIALSQDEYKAVINSMEWDLLLDLENLRYQNYNSFEEYNKDTMLCTKIQIYKKLHMTDVRYKIYAPDVQKFSFELTKVDDVYDRYVDEVKQYFTNNT